MALFAVHAEELATPAEVPTATNTPAATDAPATTETPTATEVPATTEAPTATEAPAPTEAPAATEAPAPTEAPTPTDVPTATNTPTATETPAATDVPAATDAPTPTNTPAPAEAATPGEATPGEATPGEATPGEAEEEPTFSPGYVRLAGRTDVYSSEDLKMPLGTLLDGGVVYASEKSETENTVAFHISFSVNGQVMTGWLRADELTVMSEEEGQAYAASIDPDGASALPLEDVAFAPAQQDRPGGWGGGGHGGGGRGGGGGAQPGQATTSSHGRGRLDDTPYWGVPLEVDGAETRALTLGGDALALTVTSETGSFMATLSDNALTLSLTDDATALSLSGDALETLFASGIDSVRIEYANGSLTVRTADWLSGSAYDRLRARGITPNLLTLDVDLETTSPSLTVRLDDETLPIDGQTLQLVEGGSTP